MGLQAQQIITQVLQIAKAPQFKSQAGQWLNALLSDLCQDYDFDATKKIGAITLSSGSVPVFYGPASWNGTGVGPFALPTDYLRACDEKSIFYTVNQVPYHLVPIDLTEFDELVQQAGINNFPTTYATDTSQAAVTTLSSPALYAWPPPNGSYATTVRYFSQMPDITTPESSTIVPWFPNTNYLMTKLSAHVMKITDDTRFKEFEESADDILMRYLKLKDDSSSRAQTVKLDRRRFGNSEATLRNTKLIGW